MNLIADMQKKENKNPDNEQSKITKENFGANAISYMSDIHDAKKIIPVKMQNFFILFKF